MIKCTFNGSFEFNETHGFEALRQSSPYVYYQEGEETFEGTKYWLFIDMPETILQRKDEVAAAKKKGIKIIALFYDEARFPVVDRLIELKLVDKLILFDKKYEGRFDIPVHISDYYLSLSPFPIFNSERNGKMCYFGHKLFDRTLPAKCKHIKADSLKELYQMASIHSKGYVASTGKGEGGEIIRHNKAKYIEMLFCGLQVECQEGINTLNYEHYKDKEITADDLQSIHFINNRVIQEITKQILNV